MSEVVSSLLESPKYKTLKPPEILLGQFERVGSTFYIDLLEKTHLVHNEPYKLLLPDNWPISRKYNGRLQSIDDFFANPDISGVDKHWFRNFILSLHAPGGQIIKETNLFLALPQFLELFPKSPIQLLTRNPIGIISSFKRNNLYSRWRYDKVANIVSDQLIATKPKGFVAMQHMTDQNRGWMEHLAWLMGLNVVLLSRHTGLDRIERIIRYEEDVIPLGAQQSIPDTRAQDSIFATNVRKERDDFENRLSDKELELISKSMRQCADFIIHEFDAPDRVLLDQLFSRHINTIIPKSTYIHSRHKLGSVSTATETKNLLTIKTEGPLASERGRKLVRLDPDQAILWDHSLVTNEQMGRFLQRLTEHGYNPEYNYLLLMEHMPPSRGGRIYFDNQEGAFKKTEGFDSYPAYWVSWLAASLYAYSQGMRLPNYREWEQAYYALGNTVHKPSSNHSYAFDDATLTGQGVNISHVPDDFFGNLKIWCQDWSSPNAVNKRLAGISWKHYFHTKYQTKGERPYLTNSRVIGVRLVHCSNCPKPSPRDTDQVMAMTNKILDLMEKTSIKDADDLTELNCHISDILSDKCKHNENLMQ